jgi:ribonuclease PH
MPTSKANPVYLGILTGALISTKDVQRLDKEKKILETLFRSIEKPSKQDTRAVKLAKESSSIFTVERVINRILDPRWVFSQTPEQVISVYSSVPTSSANILDISDCVGIWSTEWSLEEMPTLL